MSRAKVLLIFVYHNMERTNLYLTQEAINFIKENGISVFSNDFVGYIIFIDKRAKTGVAVYLDGAFKLFSNTRRPLSKRRENKGLMELILAGFLYCSDTPVELPFPGSDLTEGFKPEIILTDEDVFYTV